MHCLEPNPFAAVSRQHVLACLQHLDLSPSVNIVTVQHLNLHLALALYKTGKLVGFATKQIILLMPMGHKTRASGPGMASICLVQWMRHDL